jgi:hypothetical protein
LVGDVFSDGIDVQVMFCLIILVVEIHDRGKMLAVPLSVPALAADMIGLIHVVEVVGVEAPPRDAPVSVVFPPCRA